MKFFLYACLAVLIGLPATAAPAFAVEQSLDGGAHIWFGRSWGEFRAHVGPRFAWGWFSVRPNGAVGTAFLSGIDNTPLSVGAYLDVDAQIPIGDERFLELGPGGGVGHIVGLNEVTGGVIPQAYGHLSYRWDVNLVGLMAIWGRAYEKPPGFTAGFPDEIRFTGVGLRFEYRIE